MFFASDFAHFAHSIKLFLAVCCATVACLLFIFYAKCNFVYEFQTIYAGDVFASLCFIEFNKTQPEKVRERLK